MIKEKELFDGKRIRFQNGEGINLAAAVEAITDEADKNAIPLAHYEDQVKFGGLIGGSVEDCVVFYHPDHKKDYINTVVRVSHQGKYAFLAVDHIGVSKMGGKVAVRDGRKEATRGESLSFKIGYGIASAVSTIGASRSKLEQEQDWYAMLDDVLEAITG